MPMLPDLTSSLRAPRRRDPRHRAPTDWAGLLIPPLCGGSIIAVTGAVLVAIMAVMK